MMAIKYCMHCLSEKSGNTVKALTKNRIDWKTGKHNMSYNKRYNVWYKDLHNNRICHECYLRLLRRRKLAGYPIEQSLYHSRKRNGMKDSNNRLGG